MGKFELLKKFLSWIKGAFETRVSGASARKLTAFVTMCCVVAAHIAWLKYAFVKEDFEYLEWVLVTDYTFILALFGLTTWQTSKSNSDEQKQ